MYRAYGTPSIVWSLINRLKSVVTKCPEPTALKKAYINKHGREIKVETKNQEGSTFIIQLPVG
jgi:light-regulated signal transduction histidine kinase (bacteriophytochrome)